MVIPGSWLRSSSSHPSSSTRGATRRSRRGRRRSARLEQVERLACESLEARKLLAINVFDISGTWTRGLSAPGNLSGHLAVDTDTGRITELNLLRTGGIKEGTGTVISVGGRPQLVGGTPLPDTTYNTASLTSQGVDGSSYRIQTAVRGEYLMEATWNLPTGSLASFAGGSVTFGFTTGAQFATSNLGSGTLTLRAPENQSPTDIALSNAFIAENSPIGTVVGTLSAVDPDAGDTFTYSLVAGEGSDDNGAFRIVGNELQSAQAFDFETKNSYSVRVRSSDQGGLSVEKIFTISEVTVPSTPTNLMATAGNAQVSLAWTAPSSDGGAAITDYRVQFSIDSGSSWETVNPAATTVTSATVTGLANGTSYVFRVAAVNSQGPGIFSRNSDAVIPFVAAGLPSVRDLRVMPGTISGELFATWEMPAGANTAGITDFAVQASPNNGQTWQVVDDGLSTHPYASLTGLDPSQSFVIRVAAVTVEGTGPWSAYSTAVSPSGANSDTFLEFVRVGDPGNTNDPATGGVYGGIDYEYRIGKFEITIGQYTEFLNAVAKSDPYSLWNPSMASDLNIAGIWRSGTSGGYSYSVIDNGGPSGNRPITYVSWFDAARFANWMHNGQGSGSTETGAYTLVGGQTSGTAPAKNPGAQFYIPTVNEWYKAAFYSPLLNSGLGGYYTYATQSNTAPGNAVGSGLNQVNYRLTGGELLGGQNYLTNVGAFTNAASYYGTFDQTGNVAEWPSLIGSPTHVWLRGGSWTTSGASGVSSSGQGLLVGENATAAESSILGFRLASPFDPLLFISSSLLSSPTTVAATLTGTTATITWQPPQSEGSPENLGYVVQHSTDGGQSWTTATASLPASAASYPVTGLQADRQHLFRVATKNRAGVGAFSEAVMPVVESPTTISSNTISENSPVGTVIGTLATVDPDAGDSHAYTLVTGEGSDDNASFEIVGNEVRAAATFDFETKNSYTIRVRTTDAGGQSFERQFVIEVLDVNEAPTDITLPNASIPENSPVGTVIGALATLDPDFDDSHTYTLVTGEGSADNGSFEIVGNELRAAEVFDYESLFRAGGTRLQIRIRTTDEGGLSTEKAFSVDVRDANETPTSILLSNNAVPASHSAGFLVGALTTMDPDLNIRIIPLPPPAIFTYSFVAGPGDTHNSLFTVVRDGFRDADELFLVAPLAAGEYEIRLRSTDPGGLFVEQQFVIAVANAAPTDVQLSNPAIPENAPVGTVVGQLAAVDANPVDSHTYTLVTGEGSDDNGSFEIVGNELRAAATFDFESRSSYTIRVRATDAGGLSLEKSFTIAVTNVNEPPTDIALSNAAIAENSPLGTVVGTLSTVDADAGDGHTYSLVSGPGGADNIWFRIVGNEVRSAAVFDHEAKGSYSVRVRTTDAGGLTHEESFTITVTNVNEPPTDVRLSNVLVPENAPVGTVVGTLATVDPDVGDTFTYSLVPGPGSADNGSFEIVGNELRATATFDFESRDSYTIRVRTTDAGGLTLERVFTIRVADANDVPTGLSLSSVTVDFRATIGTPVGTFVVTDQDAGEWFVFEFTGGEGADDNGLFQIVNGELRTAADFSRSTRTEYSIRVMATDSGAASIAERFVITVTGIPGDPGGVPWWFLPDFPDQPLREEVWARYDAAEGAGEIDRREMIDLVHWTVEDDQLSAGELAGLRRLVHGTQGDDGDFEIAMPSHVRNLAGKVVAGSEFLPNKIYQGEILGSLQAGDYRDNVQVLVSKWFYGSDHPSTFLDSSIPEYEYLAASGQLFAEGGQPTFADVLQGEVNSCFFLAVIGGVADTYPEQLKDTFIDNGDGTWSVRFFVWREVDGVAVRFEDYVTVDRFLPYQRDVQTQVDKLMFAGKGRSITDDTNVLWAPLLEKAYAQWAEHEDTVAPWTDDGRGRPKAPANAYSLIDYGQSDIAAAHVLGFAARRVPTTTGDAFFNSQGLVDEARATGQIVFLGTTERPDTPSNFVPRHVYFVNGRVGSAYRLIQPLPEGGLRPRELTMSWQEIGDTNLRNVEEIWIADPTRSLVDERFLLPPKSFGSGAGVVVTPTTIRPAVDVNGDGLSDSLWRDANTGRVTALIQDAAGNVVATRSLGGDLNWNIVATGDFDGDGITDTVWEQSSGGLTVMRTARSRGAISFAGGTEGVASWSVVGSGDFNGDGRSDLIWKNAGSGEHVLWLMDGHRAVRRFRLDGGQGWELVASMPTFDANGDGTTDLIWRNAATGAHEVAWMRGGTTITRQVVQSGIEGAVVAAGDFDRDGRGDVLWRNEATGAVEAKPALGGAALDWVALGLSLADTTGDGRPDVVRSRTSRGLAVQRLHRPAELSASATVAEHIDFAFLSPGPEGSQGS